MPLPSFNSNGLLPPGDYSMTLDGLRRSLLVSGPGNSHPNWDVEWRRQLIDNLEVLASELWNSGVDEIFVDGSFAEDKDHPNDIDGYFVCNPIELYSGELQRRLNLLDPHKVWTWDPQSRRPYRGYPKKQLPMWHRYRVELYPHPQGGVSQSGVFDSFGNELEFPSLFRLCRRDENQKGIVRILRGGVS